MNQSAKPLLSAGARWAGIRLVLSLVPGVAISASLSVAPENISSARRPYLVAVGAPALRFGESPPPPDLRPAAGAPPMPHEDPHVSAPESDSLIVDIPPAQQADSPVDAAAAPSTTRPPARVPPPILPDDTRAKVRAEDFLPFFQFPAGSGAAADVSVVAPVPPGAGSQVPIPPSSATYRQQ